MEDYFTTMGNVLTPPVLPKPQVREIPAGGTRELTWDKTDPDSVAMAEATFNTLVKEQGYAAFRPDGKVKEFDPTAESYIVVAQLQGG